MSNVVAIRPEFEPHFWKVRFADAVIALCPDLNPDVADEASDAEVGAVPRLDPTAAARVWVAKRFGPPKQVC